MESEVFSTVNFELANRFKHHPPREQHVVDKHEQVREIIMNAVDELEKIVPGGREQALMITAMEQAMMWANAGIARHYAVHS